MQEDPDFIAETFDFNPPSLVSLSPFTPIFSPSPRRLSSCFSQPGTPIKSVRKLAWVSLQGLLVNGDEATSAKTIRGGLGAKEAVAWELFSPIHRILIVAVVSVVAINSRKNREINELKKSIQLRDQVLSSMQQKLDNLSEQVNYFKDEPEGAADSFTRQMCEQHRRLSNDPMGNIMFTTPKGYEVLNKCVANEAEEAEERRISNLSDLSQTTVSSLVIQLNTEQKVCNLRMKCKEKDATINELSSLLQSSDAFGSKRIVELEEIIQRKNMMINKFKKDILVLEQKVVNFTRLRRSSYKTAQQSERQLPHMTDNVMYDMDNSTNSSSSDTDGHPKRRCKNVASKVCVKGQAASKKEQDMEVPKHSHSAPKQTVPNENNLPHPASLLSEISLNQTIESTPTLKSKYTSSTIRDSRSRRPPTIGSKSAIAHKRWV